MKCPKCKSTNLSTTDSRPESEKNMVRRRKKCDDCLYRWTTKEMTDSMYRYYETQIKRLQQLERYQRNISSSVKKKKGWSRGTPWTKSETDKLLTMYHEQLSLGEIAEELGRTYMSVNKRLQFLRSKDKLYVAN
jgi:transcriptional regulator NrdR family protein